MTLDELKKESCQERARTGKYPILDRTIVDGSWRPTDEYTEWLEKKVIALEEQIDYLYEKLAGECI